MHVSYSNHNWPPLIADVVFKFLFSSITSGKKRSTTTLTTSKEVVGDETAQERRT